MPRASRQSRTEKIELKVAAASLGLSHATRKFLKASDFNNLTVKELQLLVAVDSNLYRTSRSLAAAIGTTPGTLTVAIERLARKGYLERTLDPHDRRIVKNELSPSGKNVIHEYNHFQAAYVQAFTEGLDAKELDAVIAGLDRVLAMLN